MILRYSLKHDPLNNTYWAEEYQASYGGDHVTQLCDPMKNAAAAWDVAVKAYKESCNRQKENSSELGCWTIEIEAFEALEHLLFKENK